ncbi:MAG TPA: acetate kinase [Bryobacteraceae bacterium]|nr:acetate kinase [Bryobacteraceae bacterium]
MKILVLNGGSSSLKASLREIKSGAADGAQPALWEAAAEWGRLEGKASVRVKAAGTVHEMALETGAPEEALRPVMEALWTGPAKVIEGVGDVDAIGHRVVHGGKVFTETTRITSEVRTQIARQAQLAPEHNRLELEAIEAAEQIFGSSVPQIAVFDTQFHVTMPEDAKVYPTPFDWYRQGIRRYGFHGVSHQYVSRRAAEMLGGADLRLVSCHLGNGASLAAVRDGRSIDTTMGFTPLEGLMMGTRSGTIDPGIVIYLVRNCGYGADDLDRLLNRESGLRGVSGVSADMREILAAIAAGNARARLAFDVYTHRLCREIGAMTASMGGIDALVFTAGIGENCAPLREAACERLAFLGIKLAAGANERPEPDVDIAAPESRVRVLVIHTEEDWEIARECARLVAG